MSSRFAQNWFGVPFYNKMDDKTENALHDVRVCFGWISCSENGFYVDRCYFVCPCVAKVSLRFIFKWGGGTKA